MCEYSVSKDISCNNPLIAPIFQCCWEHKCPKDDCGNLIEDNSTHCHWCGKCEGCGEDRIIKNNLCVYCLCEVCEKNIKQCGHVCKTCNEKLEKDDVDFCKKHKCELCNDNIELCNVECDCDGKYYYCTKNYVCCKACRCGICGENRKKCHHPCECGEPLWSNRTLCYDCTCLVCDDRKRETGSKVCVNCSTTHCLHAIQLGECVHCWIQDYYEKNPPVK